MTNRSDSVLERVRGGIIVSSQATPGGPLADPQILTALALSAEAGGACGFRLDGVEVIRCVRARSALPIVGIAKIDVPGFAVRITPTLESALAVAEAGADIVAVDATGRPRPDDVALAEVVREVHRRGALVMADTATADQGRLAAEAGVDVLGSTLAGYTQDTEGLGGDGPAVDLIAELASVGLPVIAEGRIWSPEHARQCFAAGAFALVIGSAITAPDKITRRFVEHLS